MKKIIGVALLLFVALALVLVINTLRIPHHQTAASQDAPSKLDINWGLANRNLAKAIRYKTVFTDNADEADLQQFIAFRNWLPKAFPTVYKHSDTRIISGHSLLFKIYGQQQDLKPAIFAAHYDVVPANEANHEADNGGWQHPPFDGFIDNTHIWGRGAYDDKASVIGLLTAMEHLLSQGLKPQRSIYLAFGHDEEIGGFDGAAKIVELLQQEGESAEFVLDEGGLLTQNVVAGVTIPVAHINGAEKGYATFTLSTRATPGHASMPPRETAISRLASAILRITQQRIEPSLTKPVSEMFRALAPVLPTAQKIAVANLWLSEPLLLKELQKQKTTAAMIETTVAPTIIHAGNKDNVLPDYAEAKINFRLLPGQTLDSLRSHLENVIADQQVTLHLESFRSNPTPYAGSGNKIWDLLAHNTQKHFPKAIITPGLTVGTTDARHYVPITNYQYRFLPILLEQEDIDGFHGINERISLENWHRMIHWYVDVLAATAELQ